MSEEHNESLALKRYLLGSISCHQFLISWKQEKEDTEMSEEPKNHEGDKVGVDVWLLNPQTSKSQMSTLTGALAAAISA
jgi:hypothetical protein